MAPLLVAAGGALGALMRWLIHGWIKSGWGNPGGFPLGIFIINVSGCFLFGLLAGWSRERGDAAFLFIHTGILGGYTTFSSFGADTLKLIEDRHLGMALVNAGGSVLAGVLAVWLGTLAARAAGQ